MKANSNFPPSHARDLVAQVIQDDPERAETLMQILVLADASTPKGAAFRTDLMMSAYSYTEDCREAMKRFIAA